MSTAAQPQTDQGTRRHPVITHDEHILLLGALSTESYNSGYDPERKAAIEDLLDRLYGAEQITVTPAPSQG